MRTTTNTQGRRAWAAVAIAGLLAAGCGSDSGQIDLALLIANADIAEMESACEEVESVLSGTFDGLEAIQADSGHYGEALVCGWESDDGGTIGVVVTVSTSSETDPDVSLSGDSGDARVVRGGVKVELDWDSGLDSSSEAGDLAVEIANIFDGTASTSADEGAQGESTTSTIPGAFVEPGEMLGHEGSGFSPEPLEDGRLVHSTSPGVEWITVKALDDAGQEAGSLRTSEGHTLLFVSLEPDSRYRQDPVALTVDGVIVKTGAAQDLARSFVISVPQDAEVYLEEPELRPRNRLNLRTGERDDEIEVLYRRNTAASGGSGRVATGELLCMSDPPPDDDNCARGFSFHAGLAFTSDGAPVPSGPERAWLFVDGLPARAVTLDGPEGKVEPSHSAAGRSRDNSAWWFDVPSDFTEGSLVVNALTDNARAFNEDYAHYTIELSIPMD